MDKMKRYLRILMAMLMVAIGIGCTVTRPNQQSASLKPPDSGTVDDKVAELTAKTYKHGGAIAETITWQSESAITVTIDKRVVFRRAFFSDSGHNGYHIRDVEWSPNGARLAFRMSSAGGHMPYRSWVKVLKAKTSPPVLIDAEAIIRNIPDISNVAVSHYNKPYIKWLSDTQLQVNVMSHNKEADVGMYVINIETLTAKKQLQPNASADADKPRR